LAFSMRGCPAGLAGLTRLRYFDVFLYHHERHLKY
jgi:hypothetical protein